MAQPRTPLAQIADNRQKNSELTCCQRAEILGALKIYDSPALVAEALDYPRSTVTTTRERAKLRANHASLPRSGPKLTWRIRDVRKLVRYCRTNPKDTWQQVKDRGGFPWSRDTLKVMLQPSGIANWKAKQRPELTEAHVAARLAWAIARSD